MRNEFNDVVKELIALKERHENLVADEDRFFDKLSSFVGNTNLYELTLPSGFVGEDLFDVVCAYLDSDNDDNINEIKPDVYDVIKALYFCKNGEV